MKSNTLMTRLIVMFAFTLAAPQFARAWQESDDKKVVEVATKERVAELLDLLEEQNKGADRFKDAWMLTLKELVDAGPSAVPQMIAELDATEDDMMQRCMGFCLRAINDKRAVPALIRAIPKTLRKPGSDMGIQAVDKNLGEFMRKHDLDKENKGQFLSFGRPVREILGALAAITGQSFDDEQLFHIFVDGTARQRRMKEELFFRHAKKWADWWETNAAKHVKDETYFKVNLPELAARVETKLPKGKLQHFRIEDAGSNWLLESFSNPKARIVFHDFDTGRTAGLPAKWKTEKDLNAKFAEIEKWATEEGFDLMGAEFVSPVTGKAHFALRPLGLEAWELGESRWKMQSADITFESLISEGKAVSAWLLHHDQDAKRFEPEQIATFLFRTKEGTPGLVFVGIEVHDDTQKAGVPSDGSDNELNPVHFFKGRRFGFSFFEELDEKK